jgi:hypothetical protein
MTGHVAHGIACLVTTGIAFIAAVAALRWVSSLTTTQSEPANGKNR